MINATTSLPTTAAPAPKDPTFGAKPATPAMQPKKKTPVKMVFGLLGLVLIVVGIVAGYFLLQQRGLGDVRQQAAGNACPNGPSYCGSGSGVCATGYNPSTDSACPNGIRCTCNGGITNQACNTIGATCTYSGCALGSSPISGDSCGDGTRTGTCCRTNLTGVCYDLNQGCARLETDLTDLNGCGGGTGAGKYPSLDLCKDEQRINCCVANFTHQNVKRSECRALSGTEGACAAQQNRGCYYPNNCATSIQVMASVACPAGMLDSNASDFNTTSCGQTVNCFYPSANTTQQTARYRCLETNGIVYDGCPAGTTIKQAQNGTLFCQCNSNANLSVNPGATVATATSVCNQTGATPTPGTGGTGQLCPNVPHLPAVKYVKFTCPNGCTQTTENGVTAWRCYDKRQDSATPLTLNGECGQVDVLSGTTDATYCGYSEYTCGEARCQPQPSPTPSTQVSCAQLQTVDATTLAPVTSVTSGQSVRFRCVPSTGVAANYYFFTLRTSTTAPLDLIYQGTSDLTFPITVTDYTHVQCNPCVGTTCASAQNVNQSCNFEYTKTTSPGPQCLALWMASVQTPTVPLTNPKVGDHIYLGCGQVQGAARYIFRVREPDGNVVNLGPLDATSAPRTSAEFAITKQGRHYAQCQICTGQADSTCFAYEALPTP